MKTCYHCGNSYDKCFDIVMGEETYTFDCFECAIHCLAPVCAKCECRILGHGVETDEGAFYCSAHCARSAGEQGLVDHAESQC